MTFIASWREKKSFWEQIPEIIWRDATPDVQVPRLQAVHLFLLNRKSQRFTLGCFRNQ